MRGLPWLRLVLVVAVFIFMGWPVWRLTHPRTGTPPPAAAQADPAASTSQMVDLTLQASFAGPPPATFQIKQATQTILQEGDGKKADFTARWSTALPKEGVDLTLQASWPADTAQSAVRVSVSLPGGQTIEKFYWARESLVEIFIITETALEPSPAP